MFQVEYWLIYALLSALFYGLWGFFSKLATNYINPKSALVYEAIGFLLLVSFALYRESYNLISDVKRGLEAIVIWLDKVLPMKSFSFNSDMREVLIALAKESFSFDSDIKGVIYATLVGATGGVASLFFLLALNKGHASAVVPITALYPIFTIIMAYFILKEPITLRHIIGLILALIAVVLFAKVE